MGASEKTVSVKAAIARGQWVVNGPVMALMFVPAGLALLAHRPLAALLGSGPGATVVAGASAVGGWVLAWIWWSHAVVRWRLWAYEHVEDIPALKQRAVEVGLTWPDGHVFGRTEVKSAAQAAREKALERGDQGLR